jgi:hypothetical protein
VQSANLLLVPFPSSAYLFTSLPACTPQTPPPQVTGTLRDQLLYPFPPRAVWQTASTKER